MAATPLFWAVLAFFAVERGVELAINRRNSAILAARGARWWGENDGFAAILTSQVVLFGGLTLEVVGAPWSGPQPWTLACIIALALVQALRYWCITTLGWRWSIRIVTLPGVERIVRGPYRFFPHPNYVAVMAEAVLLPLAFGAWGTLVVAAPLQLVALWRRVRLEERALSGGAEASAEA